MKVLFVNVFILLASNFALEILLFDVNLNWGVKVWVSGNNRQDFDAIFKHLQKKSAASQKHNKASKLIQLI